MIVRSFVARWWPLPWAVTFAVAAPDPGSVIASGNHDEGRMAAFAVAAVLSALLILFPRVAWIRSAAAAAAGVACSSRGLALLFAVDPIPWTGVVVWWAGSLAFLASAALSWYVFEEGSH